MKYNPPLVTGRLISRYKRFLFDAELQDGTQITGSCPNTGSMEGLTAPGSPIFMSLHDNSKTRKYRHALEIVEADGTLVGINTGLPNKIAIEAIENNLIPPLSGFDTLARERKYGTNSRIDILLSDSQQKSVYVEVKNVHFSRQAGLAEFPDTKTARGAKHLEELIKVAQSGQARAAMLYVIQRSDCHQLSICGDLDPVYFEAYRRAIAAGVEIYALKCTVSQQQITATGLIPVSEPGIQ